MNDLKNIETIENYKRDLDECLDAIANRDAEIVKLQGEVKNAKELYGYVSQQREAAEKKVTLLTKQLAAVKDAFNAIYTLI